MKARVFVAVIAAGGLCFAWVARSDPAPDSVRVSHLAAAGRLWSALEIFHPWVPERPTAWDSAWVRAVPAIREARTTPEFVAAIDTMLATLRDPATRVLWNNDAWIPSRENPDPAWRWLPDSTLVVSMNNGADLFGEGAQKRFENVADEVHRAKTVVFDLRALRSVSLYPPEYFWSQSGIDQELVRERVFAPATRSRAHVGWRGYIGTASAYNSYWRVSDGLRLSPVVPGPPVRLVALVNARSWIPGVVFALQTKGTAAIVSEGPFGDAASVPMTQLPIGTNLWVQMRTADLVTPDGTKPHADTTLVLAPGDSSTALEVALALARRASPLPRASGAPIGALPQARPVPESYATMRSPELPWRLLAANRIWSRVEYWEAYRHLLGDRWDRAFEQAIPSFEAAEDSTAYALAVARFYRHVEDTHGYVGSPALTAWMGAAQPPVRVRMIEGRPVVTSIVDSTAARVAGFEVGDEIVAIDGEPVEAKLARLRDVISASNEPELDYLAASYAVRGPDSSTAVVRVRAARGGMVERRTLRTRKWASVSADDRAGPVWKVLPGNLGYVDLPRLAPALVDSMFVAMANTRGIVFDNRGYPQGTAWRIAPRLTERTNVIGATFRTPIATKPRGISFRIDEQETFDQALPPAVGTRYLRPTVMLVDERTISQAEHTGLFFEAANGTTFVGSTTAGANGDITTFTVPGEIRLTFSGHDVRHADGRQLQQVGLPITVKARPTIAGLRAGRDEVLAAGVRHLEARIASAAKGKAKR